MSGENYQQQENEVSSVIEDLTPNVAEAENIKGGSIYTVPDVTLKRGVI